MNISKYLNPSNGTLEIPDIVAKREDPAKLVSAVVGAKLTFPSKIVLNGDNRMELFKNLMEYQLLII